MSEAIGGYFYHQDIGDISCGLYRWVNENGGERIALGDIYDRDIAEKIVFLLNENLSKHEDKT